MRLIVISNRLPFTVSFKDGVPEFKPSAGGLTTGLWSYLERKPANGAERPDFLWMGWPGASVPPEHEAAVNAYGANFNSSPVFLPEDSMDRFYLGFCNKTIWPLFHYFPTLTHYEEDQWQEYRHVNQVFSEAVVKALRPDDVLWIHDYHLMLLPKLVREKFPEMPIGFFLHIPFPSWEIFRMLPRPWREEIIEGLLGSSLIGFHTHDYVRDFLTSVLRTSGYEHQLGNLTLRDRAVEVETFPMGVEFDRFEQAAKSKETEVRVEELRQKCIGQKVVFSVDRLDYTKGLINRLRGYGWAPHQMLAWRGFKNYGLEADAGRLAYKWLYTIVKNAHDHNGTIPEKYNVVTGSHEVFVEYGNVGTKFTYIATEGFGWMNASFEVGMNYLSRAQLKDLNRLNPPPGD